MVKYALRRLITSLLTLYLVVSLTFFLMQAVPGGPFLGDSVNPEVTARLLAKYGYDKPLGQQYIRYMSDLFHGDMGYSMVDKAGMAVTDIITKYFPISLKLGMMALAAVVFIGIPLGVAAAVRHGSVFDRCFQLFASVFSSVPSFIMTVALMLIFSMWLQLLDAAFLTDWKSYILPVFGMSISGTFSFARLTRTSMLDVTGQDYIRTAKAKGLPTYKIMLKHALRNALIPVVTSLGPMVAGILTGSFVVERVFSIAGIGKYFISSISSRDYPLIMGTTIFYAILLIICNYIVDMLYGIIDPRIKLR
jgi:oligopeptide transport system permease protein